MILKRFIHVVLASVGMISVLSSCVNEDMLPCTDESKDQDRMVNLTFSVIAPSVIKPVNSRAGSDVTTPDSNNYFEGEATQFEKIHTLRIIIVRPDGTIEQNDLVSLNSDYVVKTGEIKYKVVGGEAKNVYVLANAETLGYRFTDMFKIGERYIPGTIENITLNANANGVLYNNETDVPYFIPMAEMHQVTVRYPGNEENPVQIIEEPLFVTRAAVKFSFNVQAEYGDGLFIQDIIFKNIANKEYLLPRNTIYSPGKGLPAIPNWDEATDSYLYGRFITAYTVPDDAVNSSLSFAAIDGAIPTYKTDLSGGKLQSITPYIYFCETSQTSITTPQQPYSIALVVAGKDDEGNFIEPNTFEAPLPNLPSLPRNTHVKVNITLNGADIECDVVLIPYIEVELDPIFGFEELKPKKDENTQD